MKFYKEHYDVIIMGAGLAGLSAALQLQARGITDILILEKHNLPGGLATSYVRNGIEIEATLHEMMSIGSKQDRLKVGTFFDEMGIDIDWLKVRKRIVLLKRRRRSTSPCIQVSGPCRMKSTRSIRDGVTKFMIS